MSYQVSSASMIMMSVSLVAGIAMPVLLFLFFRFKFKCKALPFWIGCATMFVFAFILEQICHAAVFGVSERSALGQKILDNIWLYGLYGALAAGVFEETGRFLAMKFVLKKYHDNDRNALMYGAGHGGIEAFMILVVMMISNLATAFMINNGMMEAQLSALSGEAYEQTYAAIQTLCETAPLMFGVGILERCIAVVAQIAFSVIVWCAAKKGGKLTFLYPVAIGLHFLLDFIAVIVNHYYGIAPTEVVSFVLAVGLALIARTLYGHMHQSA